MRGEEGPQPALCRARTSPKAEAVLPSVILAMADPGEEEAFLVPGPTSSRMDPGALYARLLAPKGPVVL